MVAYDENYVSNVIEVTNTATQLMNELFKFRDENDMADECIYDVIQEFCSKNSYSLEEFGLTIAEEEVFKDIIKENISKFGYILEES